MAKVILVGVDVALLEGLAQTLLGFGHDVLFAATVGEVAGALNEDAPAIAVVSSEAWEDEGLGTTLPITPGGAIIVYGKSHAEKPILPPQVQRLMMLRASDCSANCSRVRTSRRRRKREATSTTSTLVYAGSHSTLRREGCPAKL